MKHPLHRTTYTIFGLLFLAFIFMSYSGNAPNGYTGAPGESTCAGCHSGNVLGMNGDIQITGVPSTISPNTTYPVSVIVSNPDGISLSAGFSMVVLDANGANAGTLSNPSAGSAIATGFKDYFEHSPAQPYGPNRMVTWTVDWTSPAGPANDMITFYGIGNITDNSLGSNTGSDYIVSTSASGIINVAPTGSDLTVSNLIGWNATYAPGEVVFFDFDINNIGNDIASGDYNIMSYLSTDAFFDASDISVGDLVTGNTGVGSIPNVEGAIAIPANLPPGNYYLIIVIDALSAISELDETNNILVSPIAAPIQPSVPLVSSWNAADANCFGSNDGTATATPSGGTTPYMYSWMNGMTTQTITGLAAGNYPFTVTDANNNAISDVAVVSEPSELIASISTTDVQCASDTNGSANASINGGTLPYTIMWPGGSSMNLTGGNYIVTITDNNGCEVMENFSINTNDTTPPNVVLDQTTIISLDANGVATITPDLFDDNSTDNCGGNVIFSTTPINFTCADIGDQNIDLVISDDSGNSTIATAVATIIDNLSPFMICPTVQTLACNQFVEYPLPTVNDNCTQNITPTLVAGLPSGSEFPIGVTTITFEAMDGNNNTSACSFDVTVDGNSMMNEMSATNASCYGGEDGAASVAVSGGASPYEYQWSNMATTASISNLEAGTYIVTVTGVNGCELISSIVVEEPAEININIDLVTDDTDSGNGSIFVTASGGVPGYSYNWFNENDILVSTNEDPQNLTEGIYYVVVTDATNCMRTSLQVQISTMVDVKEIALINNIHLFPNPSTGLLNINIDSNLNKSIAFQILDQNGKLVYNIEQIENLNQTLDLTHLQNGLYWCKFIVEDRVFIKRIVMAR